jgi:hypothetical protein
MQESGEGESLEDLQRQFEELFLRPSSSSSSFRSGVPITMSFPACLDQPKVLIFTNYYYVSLRFNLFITNVSLYYAAR